jgi:hypothetical protein
LLTDVQSLLSALTGSFGSSAKGTATSGAAATSADNATSTQTGLSSSILQDLQTVASDLGTISSASGTSQSDGSGGPPGGAPPWGNDSSNNDISNTGTSASDGNPRGWRPGYSDGFQQQYAASAYGAGMTSGLDSSTTSSLNSITV